MNRHTRIIKEIISMYPDAVCELNHRNAYELLIATMLSAQTTDRQVNIVSVDLFERYPNIKSLSEADVDEVKTFIRSIGFYNSKAANIVDTAKMLMNHFDGVVPSTMEDLITLPGVGRKTANVVLSNAFGIPSFAVDTHVKRVTNRLALTKNTDPDKIEVDITSKIPKYLYISAHHAIIFHGRRRCKASNPTCEDCMLTKDCKYYKDRMKEK